MTRLAALGVFVALGLGPAPASDQIPATFTNLKVLPKTITRQELVPIMRNFAMHLGVRCERCHVGTDGNDLSTFDFASDERPAKATARKMMALVTDVNKGLDAAIGPAADGQPRVTCYTCHRGAPKPLKSPADGGVAGIAGAFVPRR